MGWRCWTWDARASSASSPNGLPTICRPTGSPSGSSPQGTEATGRPLRLNTNVGAIQSTYVSIRSEEHTSELQSLAYLVCRLLLEKKKNCDAPARSEERP